MNVTNEFKLVVDSKSINESFCRMVVSAFAGPLDPTIEELTDLKTAVSEAVTNCIVHAYANTCGKIYITGQLLQDNIIKIKINRYIVKPPHLGNFRLLFKVRFKGVQLPFINHLPEMLIKILHRGIRDIQNKTRLF